MPDEFPTLEGAVLIGMLVAVARTSALWAGMSASPKLVATLEKALGARDLGRARSLCGRSKAATAGRFGHSLVDGLDTARTTLDAERSVERALSRTRAGVRRGHARDLVVLAVLVGAGAYAERAALDVGRLFYGLLGVAVALTVLGTFLRQRTLRGIVASRASLTEAARRAVAPATASTPGA